MFPEKLYFLTHVLSWGQQKHHCLRFHYWDYLTNFWLDNWRSIIDIVERLSPNILLFITLILRRKYIKGLWTQMLRQNSVNVTFVGTLNFNVPTEVTFTIHIMIKGQLISEWNFSVFKSPKKPTKFLTDFFPGFIGLHRSKIWLAF